MEQRKSILVSKQTYTLLMDIQLLLFKQGLGKKSYHRIVAEALQQYLESFSD